MTERSRRAIPLHVCTGAVLASLLALAGSAAAHEWNGMFLDKTSYAPGDNIRIYASSDPATVDFRLFGGPPFGPSFSSRLLPQLGTSR